MKQAVLVGAGHAHLHAIGRGGVFRRSGHALTVVAPDPFWYSGLATGMVGGLYPPELDCIDVESLAANHGATFLRDKMVGLDRKDRKVLLESGGALSYDALSLNLGSAPTAIPGPKQPGLYDVKPIYRLRELRADLAARFTRKRAPTRVVIAGGGATGVELAGNIARLARDFSATIEIAVLGGDRFLDQLPPKAAKAVLRNLQSRGVRFRAGSRVVRLETGGALTLGGATVPFDIFVNATGLKPSAILCDLDLPLGPDGTLAVDKHLRSPADPLIHAGGDCAALEGHTLPRIGVYAVRQAPVLLDNLVAALDGSMPRTFVPQRRYLWIMNLGDGTGLAVRGRFWWHGRSAFRLKDWIDRRFLRAYQPD